MPTIKHNIRSFVGRTLIFWNLWRRSPLKETWKWLIWIKDVGHIAQLSNHINYKELRCNSEAPQTIDSPPPCEISSRFNVQDHIEILNIKSHKQNWSQGTTHPLDTCLILCWGYRHSYPFGLTSTRLLVAKTPLSHNPAEPPQDAVDTVVSLLQIHKTPVDWIGDLSWPFQQTCKSSELVYCSTTNRLEPPLRHSRIFPREAERECDTLNVIKMRIPNTKDTVPDLHVTL